jgi:L-lactate dehydrogenase
MAAKEDESMHGTEDRRTIAIVGAGRVGSTTALAFLMDGLADTITLVDRDPARAEGESMDLSHGLPYLPPAVVESGGIEACAGADLIVLTAGAARQPGDTRLQLAKRNLALFESLVPDLVRVNSEAVIIVVSNPVDILTLAVQRISGFPAERVIGTGTTLDTARLRTALARHFEVNAHNVHAYIVGEHGESEVPVWSLATIANQSLSSFGQTTGRTWDDSIRDRIGEEVRRAGAEVIRRKGSTNFAISLATLRLAKAILRDERGIQTVSTALDGQQGLTDVALSLPCIIGRAGRLVTIPLTLTAPESKALEESADSLRKAYTEATSESGQP